MTMKNSTVLIAIGQDAPLRSLVQTLESIRAIPARAVILIVGEMPVFPYYAAGMAPYGMIDIAPEWREEVAALQSALKSKTDEIEAMLQDHDVSGEVSAIVCEPSQLAETIARRAMLCDMAWISDDLRGQDYLFGQMLHGILFQSPVGVMLNDPGAKAIGGAKRIFVAWTNHLHSARAVQQALPLLRHADEVTIATINPVMTEYRDGEDPGVDVAKWLTHHGCKAVVRQYPSGGKDIGDCILARAKEVDADLIVMGSYSRSKTREAIFGGTTRTMIAQTDQTVFLAH
jgi:nucleotide-binding universal stress UspA family protein